MKWLRTQAGNFKKKAEAETDAKKKQSNVKLADRLLAVAAAFEASLAGADPGAFGGHAGLVKRLMPGTVVEVQFVSSRMAEGMITAMGRYDFAMVTRGGEELVVPKQAVMYWVVVREEEGEKIRQEIERATGRKWASKEGSTSVTWSAVYTGDPSSG